MKIAVSCDGNTLADQVNPRFGRCKYFILVDTESDAFQIVDNAQNLNAAQGAGIQSAQTVINNGAEAVITGHCGPKAFRTLAAAEIAVYLCSEGCVKSAIESVKAGTLKPAQTADVEGHW